jgi:6,7-dimethyl-8-ribityllumazine synthase
MGQGIDYAQVPTAASVSIAVVAARWNAAVVEPMLAECQAALRQAGVQDLQVVRVPGAFELPVAAARLVPHCDAVICIGAVIRGDTPHFDYVAGEAARGIQQVAVTTGVPVLFGVLTTDTAAQAEERADPRRGNKGREFALSALETVLALAAWPPAVAGRADASLTGMPCAGVE